MKNVIETPIHGGNIREIARMFNKDEASLLDFSANINPLGMSEKAKNAIIESITASENYPDNNAASLIEQLSTYHSMDKRQLLAGAGAIEFIYLIPRLFPPGKALIVGPAFSDYERALRISGWEVDYLLLNSEENFKFDLEQLKLKFDEGYGQLWIANPANPTGIAVNLEAMSEIIKIAQNRGVTVVVDEAFIDFCEEESFKKQVTKFENLIVIRSLTKFFALAGLRIGYVIANSKIIQKIALIKEPWRLNSIAEAAAVESLKDKEYIQKTLENSKENRKEFLDQLNHLDFLKTYQGAANFLLVHFQQGISVHQLREDLIGNENIVIRSCSNFKGLDHQFARFAVKSRSENNHLIEALARNVPNLRDG